MNIRNILGENHQHQQKKKRKNKRRKKGQGEGCGDLGLRLTTRVSLATGYFISPYCRIVCWSVQPGSWSVRGARLLSWPQDVCLEGEGLGEGGFGDRWTDGLLLLADHRPLGPRPSFPYGRRQ